jgi:fibronectin-binding autotransporter adhesin
MKPLHSTLFSIFVSLSLPVAAQSTWNGTTSTNWSVATNWAPGIPASGQNITIANTTGNSTLTLDGTTSRAVGSITDGTTGARTAEFTVQSGTNTLTIGGGVTANGSFTGIGMRLKGNIMVSANQVWSVGGTAGSASADAGIIVQEASTGNRGTFTLNGTITKTGGGLIGVGASSIDGPGDIVVNEGGLKMNAGGSLELRATGTGKFILNNASSLYFSKNSGTFGDASTFNRAIQFNGTANLATGGNVTTGGPWAIFSNIEWNGTHNITIANSVGTNAPNLNYQLGGVMSGSGSITKLGPSQLHLIGAGSNTLSGLVTVTAGELRLAKTAGATAVAGDILINGGILRLDQPNQIADTANMTITSGQFINVDGTVDTIGSLNISSAAVTSLSGITVAGATTITNGTQDINSGYTFSTNSLTVSNNAILRAGGNTAATTVNVGSGGMALNNGTLLFGGAGGAFAIQTNLSGDVTSSGISQFSSPNYSGVRAINLQGGARAFAVNDGTLDIKTTVDNGTLVKSGAGTLVLSHSGSTGNYSFTQGPVKIVSEITGGNVALSGGSLLMDIGGNSPAKITASGNFTSTGGSIEISAVNGVVPPGSNFELIRYSGNLVGTPTINIPAQLLASRMNPVLNYGAGTDSAITLETTDFPLALTWNGAKAGGVWDTKVTANFDGGAQKFYPLDFVYFYDSGVNSSVVLNSAVFPTEVTFDHGITIPTYTLSGTGGITGTGSIVKSGTGTTILATDNTYTGSTTLNEGRLQIGNGGLTGSIGTGPVYLAAGSTLAFSRSGMAVVGNAISGEGTILNSGSGTVAFTANSNSLSGEVKITGGILQLGNGGADGALGMNSVLPFNVSAGASLAIKRTGSPIISGIVSGGGGLIVSGGDPSITGVNTHTGGTTVQDDGVIRAPGDSAFGSVPAALTPNAIRLNRGGLKNSDSDTTTDALRGITITDEAYFIGGWSKKLTIAGPITGNGNIFICYDNGSVVFANTTSDWNGILTLGSNKPGFNGNTGGNLSINTITNGGVAGPLGKASAAAENIVFNGGRLIYSGESASTNRGFTLQGAGTIDVVSATTNLTITGQPTGAGTLLKAGDGTLVFPVGNSAFVGPVRVDDGVLSITHSNALGDPGKKVDVFGDAAGNRLPELQLSGGISPTISSLTLSGAGVANLAGALRNVSGDNTITATTEVNFATGNGGTTIFSDAGTLTLNSPLLKANTTGRTLTLAGPGNGVINGVLANGSTGALPVTKAGTGKWTLKGANTYSGATTVSGGILSLGQAALNDTAAVTVAAGATLNLNFSGNDRVGSLTINGVVKTNGLYNAATDPGFITGSGNIRVGPEPAGGYTTWAADFAFTPGVNDGPTNDPDGDGISNLLEYALGGIPIGAGASNTAILPSQSLNATNLVLTFRRSDLSEADVTLKVQWSENLAVWNDFAIVGAVDALPAVDITEDSPGADVDTVVVTIPRSTTPGGKLFTRLQAVK